MAHKILTINFDHKLKYSQDYDYYTIQMKHRRRPWWLLLLLLLLLFVKCEKDITVICCEPDTNVPVTDLPVKMEYEAHYLWNNGKIFASDSIVRTQTTDSIGQTVFKDLPCSVYSYIFYCLSKVSFTAESMCHSAYDKKFNFHYTRHAKLVMAPRLADLHIKIVDLETDDLLPDATLVYKYVEQGTEKIDSVKTDAGGIATIPEMRYCSIMNEIRGSCYGYADTLRSNVPCEALVVANDSTKLRLRPIKQRFTFFVKNKESKEPIPEAICEVVLTRPTGTKSVPHTVRTSIDGKGIAIYEDAFVIATIGITASKLHYNTDTLSGGPWTVEKFAVQDDDTRTVWLTPEPYLVEYMNVDSINGKPIAGVRNEIIITDATGKVEKTSEISNENGVFPVTAKEGSKIEIVSSLDPLYKKKSTVVEKFNDKEIIRMSPQTGKVKLRTVRNVNGYPLLPQCDLKVTGSISGNLNPANSGNGEFVVEARLNDNISVVASKKGYETNSTTVRNIEFSDLKNGKNIPLKLGPVEYNYRGSSKGISKECYDLIEAPASFSFTWKTCSVCTLITVTDEDGNVLGHFGIDYYPNDEGKQNRYTSDSGNTTIRSNTKTVCITAKNVNGCECTYRIKRL